MIKLYPMKIKILISLFLICTLFGQAQDISIKIEGGTSGISYDSSMGNGTFGYSGGLGVNYTCFFAKNWGLQTGVEARYNSNVFDLDNNEQLISNEIDNQASAFEYIVNPNEYTEKQHFYSFSIPVMLQYQTSTSNTTGFYFGLGAKVLFPRKQKVDVNAETLLLSGYYPDLNLEIDDLPEYGFGTINNWSDNTNVALSTSLLLSIEGGLTFKLKEDLKLYTGIYADYGLTNLKENQKLQNLVGYSMDGIDNVPANGVMSTDKIVENSKYLSAGIQLKLGFDLGRKDKMSKEKEDAVKEDAVKEEIIKVKKPINEQDSAPIMIEETKEKTPKETFFTKNELTYINKPLVFGTIDQTELPKELTERLNTIVSIVNQKKEAHLLITGFTCNLGSASLNKKIGMERAKSVATYLETQGVSKNRMELKSQGEFNPLLPNTSINNRIKNRRVIIDVILND